MNSPPLDITNPNEPIERERVALEAHAGRPKKAPPSRLNPVTVNRRLTVIKHMFKKAVEWGPCEE